MKRHIIPCILSLTLLLTACGGEQAAADTAEEAVKDHYYQILDAAGKELYTVTDSGAVAEIDALINKAGGENADHGMRRETLSTLMSTGRRLPSTLGRTRMRSGNTWRSSGTRCGRAATPSPRRSCPIPWRALGAL